MRERELDLNIVELKEVVNFLVGKYDFDVKEVARFFLMSFFCSDFCPLKKCNKCSDSDLCLVNFERFILSCINNDKE